MNLDVAEHQVKISPLAIVEGAPFQELPEDLYIPPDALKVFFGGF